MKKVTGLSFNELEIPGSAITSNTEFPFGIEEPPGISTRVHARRVCIADVIPECLAFMGVRAFHDNSTWRHLSFKVVKLIDPSEFSSSSRSPREKRVTPSSLVYIISHLELRNFHFPMTILFRRSGFAAAIGPPFAVPPIRTNQECGNAEAKRLR